MTEAHAKLPTITRASMAAVLGRWVERVDEERLEARDDERHADMENKGRTSGYQFSSDHRRNRPTPQRDATCNAKIIKGQFIFKISVTHVTHYRYSAKKLA